MQLNLRGQPSNFIPPNGTPTRLFRIPSEPPRRIQFVGPDGRKRPSTVSSTMKKLPETPPRLESRSNPYNRSNSSQSQYTRDSMTCSVYPSLRVKDKKYGFNRAVSASSKVSSSSPARFDTPTSQGRLSRLGSGNYMYKEQNDVLQGQHLSILKYNKPDKLQQSKNDSHQNDVNSNGLMKKPPICPVVQIRDEQEEQIVDIKTTLDDTRTSVDITENTHQDDFESKMKNNEKRKEKIKKSKNSKAVRFSPSPSLRYA